MKFPIRSSSWGLINFCIFPGNVELGESCLFRGMSWINVKELFCGTQIILSFCIKFKLKGCLFFSVKKAVKMFFLSVRVFLFYLQEPFAQALVNFLKRRCPQLFGINDKDLPKAVQLPAETITTTLSCLQHHIR